MSEQPEATKMCGACGKDVTSAPRVKDAKGNYYCKECAAKKQAALSKKVGTSSAPAVKAGEADVMAKLVEDSLAKGAKSCPACRRTWKEGAVICTHCGFNKESGQMVGTQVKAPEMVKGPKVVGGKGGKRGGGPKFAGAHWKVAVVLTVLFLGGFGAAIASPDFAPIFGLMVNAYLFLFGVFAAIDAYMESESILKGILVFFCGLYALYYCCVETENDLLKGTAWAYIIVLILYIVTIAMGVVAIGAAGGLGGAAGGP